MYLVTICTCGILYLMVTMKSDQPESVSTQIQRKPVISSVAQSQQPSDPGISVTLRAPLTTYTRPVRARLKHCTAIEAVVLVPDDAHEDLGVGAYMKDQDGVWFQQAYHKRLGPGRHHIHFPVSADGSSTWLAEPYGLAWNAYQLEHMQTFGLYFWSAEKHQGSVAVHHLRTVKKQDIINGIARSESKPQQEQPQTKLIHIDGFDPDQVIAHAQTGKRWEVHAGTFKTLENPFDPSLCAYDLLITDEQNQTKRFPGFYYQPVQLSDGGDHERSQRQEAGYFICRWRPQRAGTYTAALEINLEQKTHSIALPNIQVHGDDYDDYVRVAPNDTRFYQIGSGDTTKQFWPLGINLRSVNDSRGHENTPCVPTPTRGSLSYDNFLTRYANAGANCAEIWVCSWNLALE